MRCKRCGSTNISVETQQKSGYSWKKGFVGSLLFGSGGAAAGINGKSKTSTTYHCMACGLMGDFITVVMDGGPEGEINSALRYNRVSALKSLKSKYRNIEWTPPVEAAPKPSAPVASTPQSAEPLEEFEIKNGVLTKYHGKERYVEIPNGIIGIGDEAFAYCKSILSVVIPKSVTSIGKNAFDDCENLTSIVIPGSVKSIGDRAFMGCNLTSITIEDGVISIGELAFYGCKAPSVTIPKSVTQMDGNIFGGCYELETIFVEEGNPKFRSEGNCLIDMEYNTLISGLIDSEIPDYITDIADFAFYAVSQEDVVLPENIRWIGKKAYSCSGVKTVIIPKNVTFIGEKAFGGIFDEDIAELESFTFSDPHGWFIMKDTNDEGTPADENILSDPKAAAKFIRNHLGGSYLCKKIKNK